MHVKKMCAVCVYTIYACICPLTGTTLYTEGIRVQISIGYGPIDQVIKDTRVHHFQPP